jgi:CubicO group peptidase (beta-lactamase class C family)
MTTTTTFSPTNTTLEPGFHGQAPPAKSNIAFTAFGYDFSKGEAAGILLILLAIALSIFVGLYWFTCRDGTKDGRHMFKRGENVSNEPSSKEHHSDPFRSQQQQSVSIISSRGQAYQQQQQRPVSVMQQQRQSLSLNSTQQRTASPLAQSQRSIPGQYFEHDGYRDGTGTYWWSPENETWYPCQ